MAGRVGAADREELRYVARQLRPGLLLLDPSTLLTCDKSLPMAQPPGIVTFEIFFPTLFFAT